MLGWIAAAALCCATTAAASEAPLNALLQEAQRAFDEAVTLDKAGEYAKAVAEGEHALVLREAVHGGTHLEVANCLNLLGRLHRLQGELGRAEPLLQRALAIREASLGGNHPAIAASLNNLASLRLAQQRLDAAVPLLTRAFALSEQRLRQEALDFSEDRLASFLQRLRSDEERLYRLVRAYPDNARVRRLAY
jgi:tetratricopeptide (TPR) repeat protein